MLSTVTMHPVRFLPSGSFESINQMSDPSPMLQRPLYLPRWGVLNHVTLPLPHRALEAVTSPQPQPPGVGIQLDTQSQVFVTGQI